MENTHGKLFHFLAFTCLFAFFLFPGFAPAQTSSPPVKHWVKTYGETEQDAQGSFFTTDWSFYIDQASDGGYISSGFTSRVRTAFSNNPIDAISIPAITKLGPHGEKQWTQAFDGGNIFRYGIFNQIIEVADGYVAFGQKRNNADIDQIFVVKVDLNGNAVNGTPKFLTIPGSSSGLGASFNLFPIPTNSSLVDKRWLIFRAARQMQKCS